MLNKINNEQLKRLAQHSTGISNVLMEVLFPPDKPDKSDWAQGINIDELLERVSAKPPGKDKICPIETLDFDIPFTPPPVPINWQVEEYQRREQAMSLLCGRWMAGKNRCGVEISRAGEHFVLTYLKRNGKPSNERYILIWIEGDILYYGSYDRISSVALNTQSDTLMISPGVDYTRETEK